jgi:hypothetical protein
MMNRRDFLKLLLSAPIAYELDIDKLLWVPGQKTIFLPSPKKILTITEIVAIELERIGPTIAKLFDRDDFFYKELYKR